MNEEVPIILKPSRREEVVEMSDSRCGCKFDLPERADEEESI